MFPCSPVFPLFFLIPSLFFPLFLPVPSFSPFLTLNFPRRRTCSPIYGKNCPRRRGCSRKLFLGSTIIGKDKGISTNIQDSALKPVNFCFSNDHIRRTDDFYNRYFSHVLRYKRVGTSAF